MQNSTLIITGGNIDCDFASCFLKKHKFKNIIGVDAGAEKALELQIMPTHIIGDFDTISNETLQKLKSSLSNESCIQLIPEKDQTDTQEAMDLAIKLESSSIVILGGIGSRFDHTMANVQVLQIALNQQIDAYIIDAVNKIYLINKTTKICKSQLYGKYVSLLPITTNVHGVTLKGFKYPLNKYEFELGKSYGIGVSNELLEKQGAIELETGVLLIVEAKDM